MWTYCTPLLGAYIADTVRLVSLFIRSAILRLVETVFRTLQNNYVCYRVLCCRPYPPDRLRGPRCHHQAGQRHRRPCCRDDCHGSRYVQCTKMSGASSKQGAGTGGFKSNISPLVAEQQRNLKPFVRVKKNGERVIVDPAMTTARIYMWCKCLLPHYQSGIDRDLPH